MSDRRRPSEDSRRGPRPPQSMENAATNRFRRRCEAEPQRGARDALGSLGVVGIAVQESRELRMVEDERDPEERDAVRQRAFDERREPPTLLASGLEQRSRRSAPLRLRVGSGEQGRRAAV